MHYKFTGKERDSESGLDYFGARYYASNVGRWIIADWAQKPEAVPYSKLDDPQSLNLYEYVGNNPLSRADADGHSWSGFAEAMAKAYSEVTAKASLGVGVGGRIADDKADLRAEIAGKINVIAKAGKASLSTSYEAGATAKVGDKKVGLGISTEKVAASVDTVTGERKGAESPTVEWTVGTKSGGTNLDSNGESLKYGTEGGEGLVGGGEISISKEGVKDLHEAAHELWDALRPKSETPKEK